MEPLHLGAGLWSAGLPVVLSLLFAEMSWAGEEERAHGGEARAEMSRVEAGLVTEISSSQMALKSCLQGDGSEKPCSSQTFPS